MKGALEAGGRAVGVLANDLERAALNPDNRQDLMDGKLVLACPYDPLSRFFVGQAMERNKFIYALSDAALVVNTDFGRGGTWQGATEQLKKLRFVSVYVRSRGETSEGLEGLRDRGAKPWPEPETPKALQRLLGVDLPRDESPLAAPQFGPERSEHPKAEVAEIFDRNDGPGKMETRRQPVESTAKRPIHSAAAQKARTAAPPTKLRCKLLSVLSAEMSRQEILDVLNLKDSGHLRKSYLKPCLDRGWIEMTIPDKPKSVNQRFRLTRDGQKHLEELQTRVAPLFERPRRSFDTSRLQSDPSGAEHEAVG